MRAKGSDWEGHKDVSYANINLFKYFSKKNAKSKVSKKQYAKNSGEEGDGSRERDGVRISTCDFG